MMMGLVWKCFWSLEELMERQNLQLTHSVISARINMNMNSVKVLATLALIISSVIDELLMLIQLSRNCGHDY